MLVDAHHHFWNPARIPQPWMTAEHRAINRAFEPPDLEPLLAAPGVSSTVLVQSAASDADTDYMFELIEGVDWVAAVTAWIRLDDAADRLDELRRRPKFRGIRHLIHQEDDPHWILMRKVQPGLELLEEHGILLELPAVYPNHLEDVPELARRYPGLTIVVDHLAKPPLGTPDMPHWQMQLEAAAAHPNVGAKVSGLNTMVDRRDWEAADLEPAVEAAVAAFGVDRLMLGSDWPVALLNGTYAEVVAKTAEAVRAVAGEGADVVLGETAGRFYGFATVAHGGTV
jgi:L-fuconolactonase